MKGDNNWDTFGSCSGVNFKIRTTDDCLNMDKYFKQNYNIPTYFDIFSNEGFGKISDRGGGLEQFLNNFKNQYENRPEKPMFHNYNLVAYSAGGIATRWYLSGQSNPQVNKVITLHSPHGGSFIAGVAFIVHDGAILCTALATITGGSRT